MQIIHEYQVGTGQTNKKPGASHVINRHRMRLAQQVKYKRETRIYLQDIIKKAFQAAFFAVTCTEADR